MRLDSNSWLFSKPIAHRGLWGGDVIENSTLAYQNAIDKGFPIEIDIYQTLDGIITCFHDADLFRMTGVSGKIYEKSFNEISSLKLKDSQYKIPTLKEVLALVEGKVPLLIEFKDMPDLSYVKEAVDILKEYKGEFAVQSFNPLILLKIKALAPEFIRGALGTKTHAKNIGKIKRFALKNLSLNFLTKPDFISYSFEDLPLKKRLSKLPIIAWTVTSSETYKKIKPYAQNIIFENFIPE